MGSWNIPLWALSKFTKQHKCATPMIHFPARDSAWFSSTLFLRRSFPNDKAHGSIRAFSDVYQTRMFAFAHRISVDVLVDQTQQKNSALEPPTWSENEFDRSLSIIKMQLMGHETNTNKWWKFWRRKQSWSTPTIDHLVEAIRQSTEALVWGERHNSALFNEFCEHQMLATFVSALQDNIPAPVKVQILQTLSILVQNVSRTTSWFFLLSGGHLNALFKDPPDLHDEEVLTYFVTFLKSLALRLDATSARLCLTGEQFPIFDCAAKLLEESDFMVQTTARTAMLLLLRIEDPLVCQAAEARCTDKFREALRED